MTGLSSSEGGARRLPRSRASEALGRPPPRRRWRTGRQTLPPRPRCCCARACRTWAGTTRAAPTWAVSAPPWVASRAAPRAPPRAPPSHAAPSRAAAARTARGRTRRGSAARRTYSRPGCAARAATSCRAAKHCARADHPAGPESNKLVAQPKASWQPRKPLLASGHASGLGRPRPISRLVGGGASRPQRACLSTRRRAVGSAPAPCVSARLTSMGQLSGLLVTHGSSRASCALGRASGAWLRKQRTTALADSLTWYGVRVRVGVRVKG